MAERRMFAKTIIDSDAFLDMPSSTQVLYFHLSMRADDDGFINNPKKIQRMIGSGDDDLKLLIIKKFIIPFESGIVVIKHWKIHNYIQKDRYKTTIYQDEKSLLDTKENGTYKIKEDIPIVLDTDCVQSVSNMEAQVSLGKVSIELGKEIEKEKKPIRHRYGEYSRVLLNDLELEKLKDKFYDYETKIKNLDEYIEMKGTKYKNHYLTILKWAEKDNPKSNQPELQDDLVAQVLANKKEYIYDEVKEEWIIKS